MGSISLKRVIIAGIVGIEVITALAFMLAFTYYASREADMHARQSLHWAQKAAVSEVALFFEQMESTAALTQRLARDNIVDLKDPETLEKFFFDTIQANPRISGLYYGSVLGDFVFVTREAPDLAPDQTFTRIISQAPDSRLEIERIRNKHFELQSNTIVPDGTFDPRERPWYSRSAMFPGSVWSDPYSFFTSGDPGITISQRIEGPNTDSLRGVVGVDLSLAGLSEFVRELEVSENGVVFIANHDGRLIALPGLDTWTFENREALPTIQSNFDPILKDGFEEKISIAVPKDKLGTNGFQFESFGNDYVGSLTLFESEKATWLIGAYAPLDDFLDWLRTVQITTLILTIILCVAGAVGGLFLARAVNRRLTLIETSAERFLSDEDAFEFDTSSFKELEATERALSHMADQIAEREADLREMNIKLVSLMRAVDKMPIGIVILTLDGPVSFVNALASVVLNLQGDGEDKVDAAWLSALEGELVPASRSATEGWLLRHFEAQHGFKAELRHRSRGETGEETIFALVAAPIGPKSERRWAIAVEDITPYKQMESRLSIAREEAEDASRAKSMFLANMSHELRTPLNSILGFGQMIQQEAFGPIGSQRYAEYIDLILRSGQSLLEILSNLLNLTAVESGRLSLNPQPMDLAETLQASIDANMRDIEMSELAIELTAPGPVDIVGDPTKLRQAVGNIIQNAARYAQGATRLRIALEEELETVTIRLDDDGVGLPPDRLMTVLEPFRRSESDPRLAAPDGVGLGLPISKAMIELHGGRFELTCGENGRGLMVTITLPREAKQPTV